MAGGIFASLKKRMPGGLREEKKAPRATGAAPVEQVKQPSVLLKSKVKAEEEDEEAGIETVAPGQQVPDTNNRPMNKTRSSLSRPQPQSQTQAHPQERAPSSTKQTLPGWSTSPHTAQRSPTL
jgi:hypothetical protein